MDMNQELVGADSRWFIWAIVVILVGGISLISYIKITEINDDSQVTAETLRASRTPATTNAE